MGRFVTFGEIMMRLNPEGYNRFVQAERFEASYAGGEANVAVSLANYGLEASFVTELPENPLGRYSKRINLVSSMACTEMYRFSCTENKERMFRLCKRRR